MKVSAVLARAALIAPAALARHQTSVVKPRADDGTGGVMFQ
jgi:hypothetical protein